MLYKLGRILQFGGLILLPVAMAGEVTGNHDLKQMLLIATLGGVMFVSGWLLQEAVKPK